MVARKNAFGSVKEKKRKSASGIKVKKSYDYSSLPDAIANGVLVEGVKPGAELIVVRALDSKMQICLCEVKSIVKDGDTDYVTTWDMTLERFLCFRVAEVSKAEGKHAWIVKLKTPAPVQVMPNVVV